MLHSVGCSVALHTAAKLHPFLNVFIYVGALLLLMVFTFPYGFAVKKLFVQKRE